MSVEVTILDNGMTVITDDMPHLESASLGIWVKAVSQYLSPYDFNPLNINPLKELIERFVDFEAIRKAAAPVFGDATVVVQPGASHFPWVDGPAAFAAAVGSFLG